MPVTITSCSRAVGVVAPGLRHAVGICGARRLVVGVDHVVIGVGPRQPVVMNVVDGAVGVPSLGLNDRRTVGPYRTDRLVVGVERVACGVTLPGDAVIDELVQRSVGIVRIGRRHTVGVAGADRLVVGIDHVVIGVGPGQPEVMDVVYGAVGVPGLGLNDRAAIGPDCAHRLVVGIERVARRPALASDAGDNHLVQRAVGIHDLGRHRPGRRVDLQAGEGHQRAGEVGGVARGVGNGRAVRQAHRSNGQSRYVGIGRRDRVTESQRVCAGTGEIGRLAAVVEQKRRRARHHYGFVQLDRDDNRIPRHLGAGRWRCRGLRRHRGRRIDSQAERG